MLSNWLILLTIGLLAIIGVALLARRLTRPAILVLGLMLLVELVLAALSQRNWPLEYRLVPWVIDMISEERNLPTTLAAIQLGVAGVFALYHARTLLKGWNWGGAYWLLIGVVLMVMGIDEYAEIHEQFPNWKYVYGAVGIVVVAATIAIFRRQWRGQKLAPALILGGLALMAAGGMVIEDFVIFRGCFDVTVIDCYRLQIFEELFEILGGTLVLVGVMEHTLREAGRAQAPQVARFVIAGALSWVILLAAYQFLLPAVEARWLATPVSVQYLDGRLELVGYRVAEEPLTPNSGTLSVTLYWRANGRQDDEYGMSVHMEEFPDLVNVTQTDVPMSSPPATAWLPGQIVPQVVVIPVPADIQAPRDYWLLMTIWARPWYDYNYLTITASDRELLSTETVILHTVHVAAP